MENVSKTGLQPKKVAVLLGDLNSPHSIKKGVTFFEEEKETISRLKEALNEFEEYKFIYLENHSTLRKDLVKNRDEIKYVLNLCDEGMNNKPSREADIPRFLSKLRIPYTGAEAGCIKFCYDKWKVRNHVKDMVPVPRAYIFGRGDKLETKINFPVIIKPTRGDGSSGITKQSVVRDKISLRDAVSMLREEFSYKGKIMAEEFLEGDDISVGIIGNPPKEYTIFPAIKEDYSSLPGEFPKICGYEAKWIPDSPYSNLKSVPACLTSEKQNEIERHSVKLFEALNCKDYIRLDWRLNLKGEPKLLEVNPNPGWCWDGHLAKMANLGGVSYSKMLEMILKTAERRLGL
ncbi:MAG: ATP-grasp domain-containing protein [Nanoarchaeota archaeon]|nr:ATP-grasp domain-containing protein [Nanoarchaeota archaeon]MBU4086428.1 ATP-grasp domain-containing protein [Nanoarchaeota archaeon]